MICPRNNGIQMQELMRRRSKKVIGLSLQRIDGIRLGRRNVALTIDGKLIDPTVAVLMKNADQVYSRAKPLNLVWGYTDDSPFRSL